MPTLNTPFFTVLLNASTEQAKSSGGDLVQTTNANLDASQQVTDFRNLINAGSNVILAGVVDRVRHAKRLSGQPQIKSIRSRSRVNAQ
ncbi:hypothetical protein ACC687_38495, partial [Rhizobium ruizarguesonis]